MMPFWFHFNLFLLCIIHNIFLKVCKLILMVQKYLKTSLLTENKEIIKLAIFGSSNINQNRELRRNSRIKL